MEHNVQGKEYSSICINYSACLGIECPWSSLLPVYFLDCPGVVTSHVCSIVSVLLIHRSSILSRQLVSDCKQEAPREILLHHTHRSPLMASLNTGNTKVTLWSMTLFGPLRLRNISWTHVLYCLALSPVVGDNIVREIFTHFPLPHDRRICPYPLMFVLAMWLALTSWWMECTSLPLYLELSHVTCFC